MGKGFYTLRMMKKIVPSDRIEPSYDEFYLLVGTVILIDSLSSFFYVIGERN